MNKLIRKYRDLTYEQKIVVKTVVGLCLSTALACGKFTIGLLTDYNLVSIAVYTFAILLAKLECLIGIKNGKRTFRQRNYAVAALLFAASVLYIAFMGRMFFVDRKLKNDDAWFVYLLALISFTEFGFAVAGLIRTKNRGYYYRNIKIINFCVAVIAILTTQMSILNLQSESETVSIFNAYTGIGVGCFIALCAVHIAIAPKTSVIDREHNAFVLQDERRNRIVDMRKEETELTLCQSPVYGDYVFRAKIEGNRVEGDIVRGRSLWARMHVVWKVVCCILSEILIFVWLFGRLILFFRSIDLPKRLERTMSENGFLKADPTDEEEEIAEIL